MHLIGWKGVAPNGHMPGGSGRLRGACPSSPLTAERLGGAVDWARADDVRRLDSSLTGRPTQAI